MDPTYRYVETDKDVSSVVLDNLETATRYVINIQALNKFGTNGFLREPLIVQTDFGFNEVNQIPIYNGNNLPLTIILVVCGVGTMLLLFNVALIVYLIKRKKKKGEAGLFILFIYIKIRDLIFDFQFKIDSTTDTNETDANIVEMFSPPPPYPDELNYQFELNNHNFEVREYLFKYTCCLFINYLLIFSNLRMNISLLCLICIQIIQIMVTIQLNIICKTNILKI
jgi:hypothetical protein